MSQGRDRRRRSQQKAMHIRIAVDRPPAHDLARSVDGGGPLEDPAGASGDQRVEVLQ